MTFSQRLKAAKLTRAELGRRLSVRRQTVSSWGESPPAYALAYVELVERMRTIAKELML